VSTVLHDLALHGLPCPMVGHLGSAMLVHCRPCIGALDGVMVGAAVGPSALTAVPLMPVSNHL
jgi:hypothetical protein